MWARIKACCWCCCPLPADELEPEEYELTSIEVISSPDISVTPEADPNTPEDPVAAYRQQLLNRKYETLLWRKLPSTVSGLVTYSNYLDNAVTTEKPAAYTEPSLLDEKVLATPQDFSLLGELCDSLGIELQLCGDSVQDSYYNTPGLIGGHAPRLSHLLFYERLLHAELSLYPVEFLQEVGLERIVLVEKLDWKGQKRAAMPVPPTGTLYLDPSRASCAYLSSVFHHEFFHLIDVVLSRKLTYNQSTPGMPKSMRMSKTRVMVDEPWMKLNTKGFRYGRGGAGTRQPSAWISGKAVGEADVHVGFLNRYAMSAHEEDRAEVFAAMVRCPPAMFNNEDEILRAKAELLRDRLHKLCPVVDDAKTGLWKRALTLHGSRTWFAGKLSDWETQTNSRGFQFWKNKHTHQISWLDPKMFTLAPPPEEKVEKSTKKD